MLGEGLYYVQNIIGRVGKTSLTLRYCKDQFDDRQESTINATYLEKPVDLGDGSNATLAIWVPKKSQICRIQQVKRSFMQWPQCTIGMPQEQYQFMMLRLRRVF